MVIEDLPPGALPPRPNMRGRYLIRSLKSAALVGAMDTLLRLMPVRHPQPKTRYDRILVANWGHLGDVVLTLPAVAALRKFYPKAEIGMITGSWGRAVALGSGLVDRVHVADHWIVNRMNVPRKARWRETRRQALQEIRAQSYEIGIDFYAFFPPAHPLFWHAGIPRRVGFDSGGFGPLLTDAVRWRDADRPVADYARDLLDRMLPQLSTPEDMEFTYPTADLPPLPQGLGAGDYTVVHPGAGAPFKDWGEDNWRTLIAGLRAQGRNLVLTGAGEGERALAARLEGEGILNLVGRLDWNGFVGVIANAGALVCPDTVAAHLGAIFRVPTVAIFTGTNNPVQWGPYNPRARVVVEKVVCAPCNRPGCSAMACIRAVTPAAVIAELAALQA